MASILKKSLGIATIVGVTAFVTSHVVSQDYEHQIGEMDEAMQTVMKRMKKLGRKGMLPPGMGGAMPGGLPGMPPGRLG